MKYIYLSLILFSSGVSIGKEISLSEFNSKLQHNFNSVLESNPQVYEQKSFSRSPASIQVDRSDNVTEKLDEFAEQIDGQLSW